MNRAPEHLAAIREPMTKSKEFVRRPDSLDIAESIVRCLRDNRILPGPEHRSRRYEEYERQVRELTDEQRVILRKQAEAATDDLVAVATMDSGGMAHSDLWNEKWTGPRADFFERHRPPADQISPALFNEAVLRHLGDRAFSDSISGRNREYALHRLQQATFDGVSPQKFSTPLKRHLVELFSRYEILRKRPSNEERRVEVTDERELLEAVLCELAWFVAAAVKTGQADENIHVFVMLLKRVALARGLIERNPDGSIQGFEDEPAGEESDFVICLSESASQPSTSHEPVTKS